VFDYQLTRINHPGHWVNKDASAWAKSYFEEHLIGLEASESDGTTVKIEKVLSVEGDVDVSQRKGKVLTLFDVKIQLEYIGKLYQECCKAIVILMANFY